jgi:signal transduction histidine kinase
VSNLGTCNGDCINAAKLASLHNSAAILEFGADGAIHSANERFLSLFDYRMGDLHGDHPRIFWDLVEADVQQQKNLWSKLRAGKNHLGAYECHSKEGRPLSIFASFSPVMDASGKLIQVIAIMSDARELAHQLKCDAVLADGEKAKGAADEAERAKVAKAEFLASMSHELRTPLNAIIGFSDLIERQLFGPLGDEKYQEYAQAIHQSGHTLLNFVDAVLALSKVSAGKMKIHEKIFAVDYLITYCLNLAGPEAESRVSVRPAASDDLFIRGDFRLLAQALLNILSNALKFTPKDGAIAVTTRKTEIGGLAVEVSDTGMGMSHDDIQKALSPYGRIQAKVTGGNRGCGFGLSISCSFMELHGGEMEIASSLGLGTKVSLLLPNGRVAASFDEAAAL